MSRGCAIVKPCGCWLLDGRPYKHCSQHAKEDGRTFVPSPEVERWVERHTGKPMDYK